MPRASDGQNGLNTEKPTEHRITRQDDGGENRSGCTVGGGKDGLRFFFFYSLTVNIALCLVKV